VIDAPKNKLRAPIRPLNVPTVCLTVLGLGFLRPAPGTWGSLPPPIIASVLILTAPNAAMYYAIVGAMLLVACGVCVLWGRYAESRFARKDAAEVVADETAGVSLALLFIPPMMIEGEPVALLVTFCALCFFGFRFFDILKPWPARRFEALPFGWGVLLDDLAAGVYAGVTAQIGAQILRAII